MLDISCSSYCKRQAIGYTRLDGLIYLQRIIPDQGGLDPKKVRRVLLCSGKIYYELAAERDKRKAEDVAKIQAELPVAAEQAASAVSMTSEARSQQLKDVEFKPGPALLSELDDTAQILAQLRTLRDRIPPPKNQK